MKLPAAGGTLVSLTTGKSFVEQLEVDATHVYFRTMFSLQRTAK